MCHTCNTCCHFFNRPVTMDRPGVLAKGRPENLSHGEIRLFNGALCQTFFFRKMSEHTTNYSSTCWMLPWGCTTSLRED